MTKNRKIIVLMVIAIVAIGIFIWWRMSPAQQQKARIAQAIKIMTTVWQDTVNKQNSSKFSISGNIVDDAGQPVDQVKVYIRQGYLREGGVSSQYISSTQVVNHEFKIDLSGGSSLNMDFSKSGYYNKNARFNLPRAGLTYSSDSVIAPNQKIVLERTGTLAKTRHKTQSFWIRNGEFTNLLIPELKSTESNTNLYLDLTKLRSGTIYLDVARGKNGKIIETIICNVTKRMGPRTMLLNMVGGNDDGFILINDRKISRFIDIKDAPESGYVKQMIFTLPDDLQKMFFFYYKFGAHYGKGKISSFSCDAYGKIYVDTELYQNIETSTDQKVRRNLRTK